ncbi:MAG: hypothetical protein ABEK10_00920 [Candidatus Nanosalina sp.]
MAADEGYFQERAIKNQENPRIRDFDEAIRQDARAVEIDPQEIDEEYESAFIMDTDQGSAFIGYTGEEAFFIGSRSSVNEAQHMYRHNLGEYGEFRNGVEETAEEPFQGFYDFIQEENPEDDEFVEAMQEFDFEQSKKPIAADGGTFYDEEMQDMRQLGNERFDGGEPTVYGSSN